MQAANYDQYLEIACKKLDVALKLSEESETDEGLSLFMGCFPPFGTYLPGNPENPAVILNVDAIYKKYQEDPASNLDQRVFDELYWMARIGCFRVYIDFFLCMVEAQRNNHASFHIDIQAIGDVFLDYHTQGFRSDKEYFEPYNSIIKDLFGRGLSFYENTSP